MDSYRCIWGTEGGKSWKILDIKKIVHKKIGRQRAYIKIECKKITTPIFKVRKINIQTPPIASTKKY